MKKRLVCLALLPFLLNACSRTNGNKNLEAGNAEAKQAYSNLLKKEGGKKDRVDSIFYGIYFKMSAHDFYDHCSKMYKQGLFSGGYDMQVVVKLNDPFKRAVKLTFYPSFDKPFISRVKCHFGYVNANIFNKADRSGVLMKELIPVLMSWYGGNAFLEMPSGNPLKGPRYVKVDSNRKIDVSEHDNGTDVEVVFEDLKP